jgi:hypothetical protein
MRLLFLRIAKVPDSHLRPEVVKQINSRLKLCPSESCKDEVLNLLDMKMCGAVEV